MRRKIAIGTLGILVLLAAAIVSWAQEGDPQGTAPGQGQHQMGGGTPGWGHGPRHFDGPRRFQGGGRGQFGRQGWAGRPGMRRMGMRPGAMGGGGLLRMAENPRVRQALNLTDDQVTRLHTIGVESEKATVQLRADLQLRRIELRELLRADNPNQSAIMAKMDQVNELQGKTAKQRMQTMLSARGVLTPDQIKKLKTFMESRGAGMERGRMERRGGAGARPGRPGGATGGSTQKPATPPAQ